MASAEKAILDFSIHLHSVQTKIQAQKNQRRLHDATEIFKNGKT